jgi:poly(3-hydroxyalkanoate) synthetase
LFKENRLAKGEFVGLGRKLNLRDISCPTYLLAGAADEQVLDAAKYLGTPKDHIVKKTVPGGHIGLFMGALTLKEHWLASPNGSLLFRENLECVPRSGIGSRRRIL